MSTERADSAGATLEDVIDVAEAALLEHRLHSTRRLLAVPPHLDDAVLSAGSTLARCTADGTHVVVLTLFAGDVPLALSPAAVRHHERCSLPANAVELRREEDQRAMAMLRAQWRYGDYVDAVYRTRPGGRWVCESDDDLFGSPPTDRALFRALVSTVTETIGREAPDLVLGPAGIGSHVDHLLTRDAVTTAAAACNVAVLAWADLPYAIAAGCTQRDRFQRLPDNQYSIETKLAAAAHYVSQLPMLWPGGEWRQALSDAGEAFCDVSSDWTSAANSRSMRSLP